MEIPAGVIVLKNKFLSIQAGIFRATTLLLHELFMKTSHFPSDGNYFFRLRSDLGCVNSVLKRPEVDTCIQNPLT